MDGIVLFLVGAVAVLLGLAFSDWLPTTWARSILVVLGLALLVPGVATIVQAGVNRFTTNEVRELCVQLSGSETMKRAHVEVDCGSIGAEPHPSVTGP